MHTLINLHIFFLSLSLLVTYGLFLLQEAIAAGETIRTIVKILSHEHSEETKEAVSLLYELSKSRSLCEKIGGVSGTILLLVGMASTKLENTITLEKTLKTLENLDKCEDNVKQMAENGRLQPLLTRLLEGAIHLCCFISVLSLSGFFFLSNKWIRLLFLFIQIISIFCNSIT